MKRLYPCSKARAPLLTVQSPALENESSFVRFCPEQQKRPLVDAHTDRGWMSIWPGGFSGRREGEREEGSCAPFSTHLDTAELMTRTQRVSMRPQTYFNLV